VETVIVDPFGRAYNGASQNDAGEVGAWLVRLDQWVRGEVGAGDLVLTAHAGWNQERTRGSSALEDWADTIVTLTRGEDEDGPRYMKAMGRDVDVPEDALDFDPQTRRLQLTGAGSRRQASQTRRVEDLTPEVLDYVTRNPGVSGTGIVKGLGRRRPDVWEAIEALVGDGVIVKRRRQGRGGGVSFEVAIGTVPNPAPRDTKNNRAQPGPTKPGAYLEPCPTVSIEGTVQGTSSTSILPGTLPTCLDPSCSLPLMTTSAKTSGYCAAHRPKEVA
jgi:hypothetical protein